MTFSMMAENCYVQCHLRSVTYEPFMLTVVILNVIMPSVIMLSVVVPPWEDFKLV